MIDETQKVVMSLSFPKQPWLNIINKAILALGALIVACTQSEPPPPIDLVPGASRAVIIDTDMGADEIMAILYLLQRPDVQVRAITVAGTGLAHCAAGGDITGVARKDGNADTRSINQPGRSTTNIRTIGRPH